MGVYIVYKQLRESKAVVADFASGSLEWREVPAETKTDCEYSDDLVTLVRSPSPEGAADLKSFVWRVRNRSFRDLKLSYIPPRSPYSMDLGGQFWVSNRVIGVFTDLPHKDRLHQIVRNGALLLIDSPTGTILRVFEREGSFSDTYRTSTGRNESTKEVVETEPPGLDRLLFDLLVRSHEPLRDGIDRCERRLQDLVTIKESMQRLEMRVRNLSGNLGGSVPAEGGRTDESIRAQEMAQKAEQVDRLLLELDNYRRRTASLEIALRDTEHRLETSEHRVIDQVRSAFFEAMGQMKVYMDPDYHPTDSASGINQLLSSVDTQRFGTNEPTQGQVAKLVGDLQNRNEHLLHTLKLVERAFRELGWVTEG